MSDSPSNTELREAIAKVLDRDIPDNDEQEAALIDDLIALFQAREQQILTELLDDDGWHYHRTCLSCGKNWWGLHCPHDGYQNPCPACGEKPAQVLLNPIKSDTCGCEFVVPVSVIERLQNKTNDGGRNGG